MHPGKTQRLPFYRYGLAAARDAIVAVAPMFRCSIFRMLIDYLGVLIVPDAWSQQFQKTVVLMVQRSYTLRELSGGFHILACMYNLLVASTASFKLSCVSPTQYLLFKEAQCHAVTFINPMHAIPSIVHVVLGERGFPVCCKNITLLSWASRFRVAVTSASFDSEWRALQESLASDDAFQVRRFPDWYQESRSMLYGLKPAVNVVRREVVVSLTISKGLQVYVYSALTRAPFAVDEAYEKISDRLSHWDPRLGQYCWIFIERLRIVARNVPVQVPWNCLRVATNSMATGWRYGRHEACRFGCPFDDGELVYVEALRDASQHYHHCRSWEELVSRHLPFYRCVVGTRVNSNIFFMYPDVQGVMPLLAVQSYAICS